MSLVTLGGASVLSGTITRPVAGAWHAFLEVDAEEAPSGLVALDVLEGTLSLSGAVVRASDFRQRIKVEVVGGAGKLGAVLPAKAYGKVTVRTVLVDSLLSAGERLASTSDLAVLARALPRWVRPAGPLRDTLTALVAGTAGAVWRVLADGTVWVGVPTWSPTQVDYELHDDDALARRAIIRSDDFDIIDAGVSLDGRKVLTVRHVLDERGIQTELELAA